jgi:hypothetical protein
MRLFFVALLQSENEVKKQDQSGILAQKFSQCGNLLAGNFCDAHSSPESHAVSSTAFITAAENVQN